MLPSIGSLPKLDSQQQAEALGLLFEPCPTLIEYIQPVVAKPHDSWRQLIEEVRTSLEQLLRDPKDERIPKIIAAHPRLGAKKVDSALSQAEQASLQAASEVEAAQLAELNAEYEKTFPGLRYVVFVAGRPRSVIMEDMRARIGRGDYEAETRTAVNAMCDIALDRARGLEKL